MKTRLIYFALCLTLVNCKEQKPELTFKYADKPTVINCDPLYSGVLNEALYNFEAILDESYTNKNPNLSAAYSLFIKESISNKTNYNSISNQYALDIFESLKNIEGLWVQKNNELALNYKHKIFSCIGDNIIDKDLKATYNALLTTNSMSMRMLKDVLMKKSRNCATDKYLASFVALELYYSKLANVDLSLKEEKPLDTETQEAKDPHAGHNHD